MKLRYRQFDNRNTLLGYIDNFLLIADGGMTTWQAVDALTIHMESSWGLGPRRRGRLTEAGLADIRQDLWATRQIGAHDYEVAFTRCPLLLCSKCSSIFSKGDDFADKVPWVYEDKDVKDFIVWFDSMPKEPVIEIVDDCVSCRNLPVKNAPVAELPEREAETPLLIAEETAGPQPVKQRAPKMYLMKDKALGLYKIGRSVDPRARERTLQAEKPSIEMVATGPHGDHEIDWHNRFHRERKRGEWFQLSPAQVRFAARAIARGQHPAC